MPLLEAVSKRALEAPQEFASEQPGISSGCVPPAWPTEKKVYVNRSVSLPRPICSADNNY